MKKIFIICSKKFYGNILEIKENLEKRFEIYLPNCYDDPSIEERHHNLGIKEHSEFKSKIFKQSEALISKMDAVLVLNFDKNNLKNYIGGPTFLKMDDAFGLGKDIY